MPGHRPLAVLVLAAALACACEPVATPTAPERPAPPARGARAEPASPSARVAYRAEDAIARLRARLRSRGFGPEVTAGPMVAFWSDDPPPSRLSGESGVPAAVRRAVSTPTWLVVTDGGAWWVWEHDDLGPVAYAPSSRF
jgi:hypothetical protein